MSLPYHKSVADQPAEAYIERNNANLRNLLREHPEDELHLKDKRSLTIIYMNLTRGYNTLLEFDLSEYFIAEYMKSLGFDFTIEDDDDE